jgi:hypothetical protein
MRRQPIAWAAFAVLSVAFFSVPRPGVAHAHKNDVSETVSAYAQVPEQDSLGLPSSVSSALVEQAAPAVAPETLEAPAAAAVATPAEPAQVAATTRESTPAAPVAAAPAPPAPAACPANYFCYQRVGIVGPIVPYNDCSASTDVGTAIRSLSCVSPRYLAAHAYTQFGRITGWRAGDVVVANGVRYVLYDAFTQRSCDYPARPLAPLSLQTSLTSNNCGMVLVVQGRPE